MSVSYGELEKFWEYVLFYPDEDETFFDGVHYGGIRGLRKDAPAEAVEAYESYIKQQERNKEQGIKV